MSAFSSKKMLALAVAAPAVSTLFIESGVEGLKLKVTALSDYELRMRAERRRRREQREAQNSRHRDYLQNLERAGGRTLVEQQAVINREQERRQDAAASQLRQHQQTYWSDEHIARNYDRHFPNDATSPPTAAASQAEASATAEAARAAPRAAAAAEARARAAEERQRAKRVAEASARAQEGLRKAAEEQRRVAEESRGTYYTRAAERARIATEEQRRAEAAQAAQREEEEELQAAMALSMQQLPAIEKPRSNKAAKRPMVAVSSGLTPAEKFSEVAEEEVEELEAAIALSLEQPTDQLAEDVASAAGAAGPSSASASSAPAVEQKVMALPQYPSKHQGASDADAALGSAFKTAGQPNDASGSSDSARAVAPPPALVPEGAEFSLEYRLATASSSVTEAEKAAREGAAKISEDAESARAAEREALRKQRRIKELEERAAAEQATQVPEEDFSADIAAINAATAAESQRISDIDSYLAAQLQQLQHREEALARAAGQQAHQQFLDREMAARLHKELNGVAVPVN